MVVARGLSALPDAALKGPRYIDVKTALRPAATIDQQIPCSPDVALGRLQMADSQTERQALAQPRVGQEDFAGPIDQIEEAFIGGIQVRRGQHPRRGIPPEADDAEWDRRETFEVGVGVDPRRKLLCEPDVFSDVLADGARAKRTKNHPELQRAEPPAELDAGVHQILDVTAK